MLLNAEGQKNLYIAHPKINNGVHLPIPESGLSLVPGEIYHLFLLKEAPVVHEELIGWITTHKPDQTHFGQELLTGGATTHISNPNFQIGTEIAPTNNSSQWPEAYEPTPGLGLMSFVTPENFLRSLLLVNEEVALSLGLDTQTQAK